MMAADRPDWVETDFIREFGSRYDFIAQARKVVPAEAKADMHTIESRKDASKELFKKNTEDENKNACLSCPLFGKCKHVVWSKLLRNGKWTWLAGHMRITGCSHHPDQKRFKGHSTTTVITDTTTSANLYYTNGVWNTCRTFSTASNASTAQCNVNVRKAANYAIERGAVVFDASAIPGNAVVLSGKYTLWLFGLATDDGNFDVVIQDGQPSRPSNPVITADYLYSYYSGDYGGVNTAGLVAASLVDIPFTDCSVINTGGDSKQLLRHSMDINNTTPGAGNDNWTLFHGPTWAGGTDPQMEITWKPGGVARRVISWL